MDGVTALPDLRLKYSKSTTSELAAVKETPQSSLAAAKSNSENPRSGEGPEPNPAPTRPRMKRKKTAEDELFRHLKDNGSMDEIANILRRATLGELKDAPADPAPADPAPADPAQADPAPADPAPPTQPPPTPPLAQHLTTQPPLNPPRTVQYLK
eukprot:g65018.t1